MRNDSYWDYHNPVSIRFGWGRLDEIRSGADGRCLIVTTAGATRRGLTARIQDLLGSDSTVVFDSVEANPSIESAEAAIETLVSSECGTVVAAGGGSAIDFGKVLAIALANPSLPLRQALVEPALLRDLRTVRLIAVPTTSGTGSEVTPFATLWDHVERRKHSLASPQMFPAVAILDPELTLSLPWESTLSPGLDAFSQCFEAIWNRSATPLTSALAQRGLSLAPDALRRLKKDPALKQARTDMLEASLFSGLAISRTRTALAHSISYPITAHFGLPHGLACSFTLPALLAFNQEADDGRLLSVVREFGLDTAEQLKHYILKLFEDLGMVETFREYVTDYAMLYELIPEMITPGRADNNLRSADLDDVRDILKATEAWMYSG